MQPNTLAYSLKDNCTSECAHFLCIQGVSDRMNSSHGVFIFMLTQEATLCRPECNNLEAGTHKFILLVVQWTSELMSISTFWGKIPWGGSGLARLLSHALLVQLCSSDQLPSWKKQPTDESMVLMLHQHEMPPYMFFGGGAAAAAAP